MKLSVSFADYSKFPPNYWKWLAITLLILLAIVCTKAWANGEPEWDTLIPIIIQIESGGNPNAVSKTGCIGLMQISPMVLEEYNWYIYATGINDPLETYKKEDLYNGGINVAIGTWYLKRIWNLYLPHYGLEQSIENLLIAYNFGIGNLVKYRQRKIKLPKETRNYIARYKKLAGEKK